MNFLHLVGRRLSSRESTSAFRFTSFAVALCVVFSAPFLQAQPSGASVVSGSASVALNGSTTTVTAGNNSVLRWNSFNLAPSQTVQFIQPSVDSRVLNWIGGLTPTQIDGTVRANGQVYLINPAGVFFGRTAVIDAARLYAVAGSLSKEDFFAGNDRFTNLTGEVRNDGSLQASTVALIGRSVVNNGTIVAHDGFVALASGEQVFLGKKGSSVFVDTGANTSSPNPAMASSAGVANSGTIDAGEGSVALAAGDLYSVAIVHTGKVRGHDVRVQGQGRGNVLIDGAVDVSSTTNRGAGGYAEITGEQVGLSSRASINASGATGGGTILIGGDVHGATPSVRNAQHTTVQPGAVLNADATHQGNGGKIVVWSDGGTQYGGALSARGGLQSGNGGFAEVSGRQLTFAGTSDLSGPHGRDGSLLLDPFNLTINNGTDTSVPPPSQGNFNPTGNDSTLSWASLLGALNNSAVTVSTVSTAGAQAGNITIAASPGAGLYNTANALTLQTASSGGIFVNAPVVNAGTGAILLEAGAAGVILGGTSGNTILGTNGSLELSGPGSLFGTGVLRGGVDLFLNFAGGIGSSVLPIVMTTPTLTIGSSGSVYIRSVRDQGLDILATVGSGQGTTFEIVSKDSGGLLDAPINLSLSDLFSSLRVIGSNTFLSGNFSSPSIDFTIGNSGTLVIPANWNANTITFENSGNIGAAGTPLITNSPALFFNKTGGNVYINNQANSTTVSGVSTNTLIDLATTFNSTSANVVIDQASLSANSVAINALSITLNGGITGSNIALNHSGGLFGSGFLTASTQLNLSGAGGVGGSTTSTVFSRTPSLVLNKTGDGNVYLSNWRDAGLTLSGSGGGSIFVASRNNINQSPAALTIGGAGLNAVTFLTLDSSTLTLSGNIVSETVEFDHAGDVTGSGLVTATEELSLNGAGEVGTSIAPLLTNTPIVHLNQPSGAVFLDNGTNDLFVGFNGFSGGGAFSGGFLQISAADETGLLNLGGNSLTLTSTQTLDLGSVSITANRLTLNHDGALLNFAPPRVTTLVLAGSGSDGTPNDHFFTSVANLELQKTSGASVFIENGLDSEFTVSGAANGQVSISSLDSDFFGLNPLTISPLNFSNAGPTTLTSSTLALGGGITSSILTLNTTGAISGTGSLTATTQLRLNGTGDVGTALLPISTDTPLLVLNRNAGAVHVNNGTAALALTPTAFSGGGSFRSGDLTLNGPVDAGVSNNLSFISSGSLNLGANAIRANTLTLAHDGAFVSSTGALSMTTLVLGGAGDEGSAGTPFTFSATNLVLNKTGTASAYLSNRRDLGVTASGTVGGNLALASLIGTGAAPSDLTVASAGLTANTSLSLTSDRLVFLADITSPVVTLNHNGALTGSSTLRAATQLNLSGSGSVGTSTAFIATATPTLSLNKPAGAVYVDNGAAALWLAPTVFSAGGAVRSGSFNLAAPLNVGANALAITSTAGAITLGTNGVTGGAVAFTNSGALTGTGLVTATQLTLAGAGDVALSNTQTPSVVLNKPTGVVTLNNGTTALAITPTVFTAGGAFSGGNVSLLGPVNVGTNGLSFTSSGTLNLGSFGITAGTLTLAHDGALANYAAPDVDTLILGGAGDDGTASAFFVVNTANLVLSKTGLANVYLNNRRDLGLTLSGSANSNVSIGSLNTPGSTAANLTVSAAGLTAGGPLTLGSSSLSLVGNLTSPTVTLVNTGTASGPGGIRASTGLTLAGTGDVGTSASSLATTTPAVTINKATGSVFLDNGTSDLTVTPTALTGAASFAGGNVTLLGPIAAGANPISFTSTGTLNLGANGILGGNVSINNGGALTGTGTITASQLSLSGAGSVGATGASIQVRTPALWVNKLTGAVYLDNGSLDLAFTPTSFAAGGALRSGSLSLLGPITASGASVDFTAIGTINLGGNAIAADRLILTHGGALTNLGILNVNTLGLGGSGDDGTTAAHLVISVPNLLLSKTGAGSVFVDNKRDLGLTLGGFSNANVAVSSLNTAGTGPAQLTIGSGGLTTNGTSSGDATSVVSVGSFGQTQRDVLPGLFEPVVAADASSKVVLTAGALVLNGNIETAALTINNSGALTGAGLLQASQQLNLGSTGNVGSMASPISSNTPAVVVDKLSGAVYLNNNGAPLTLTPTNFNGGGSFSSGSFTLLGPINIGGNNLAITTTGEVVLGTFNITGGTITFHNGGLLSGTGLVTANSLLFGGSGIVGSVVSPLRFSGTPRALTLLNNQINDNVHISFGDGAADELPPGVAQTFTAESRQTANAVRSEEDAGTPEADEASAPGRTSRRGSGAAFRAISAKAELASATREQLQALGVYARPLRPEERLSRERREAVFVTVPERERPRESEFEVVDARIDPAALREVLRLAAETGLTEPGKARLEQVARSLAVSFTAFSNAVPDGDAAAFRTWLESRRDSDATTVVAFVQALRSTIGQIELLGLTHQEIEVSKTQIFGSILGTQLNTDPDFLRALIEDSPHNTTASLDQSSTNERLALR